MTVQPLPISLIDGRRLQEVACSAVGWPLLLVVMFCLAPSRARGEIHDWLNPVLHELRENQIQLQLEQDQIGRAEPSITSSEIGAQYHMGLRSPAVSPWVQLDLGSSRRFDIVAVIPAIQSGRAYAFPLGFRVDTSDDPAFGDADLLFQSNESDHDISDTLPVIIPTPGAKGRYIRITITKLASVVDRLTYALGEIMVVRGNRNIAVGARVEMQLSARIPGLWNPKYLVDSRTPLGEPIIKDLPEADGVYTTPAIGNANRWMMIDLAEPHPVDEIRLHPVFARQGAYLPGYAFPLKFRVEGSLDRDFAEKQTIFDTLDEEFSNPGNNVVVLPASGRELRYIKVTCIESTPMEYEHRMGLSEIQVYSGDQNVALGKQAEIPGDTAERPASLLTDNYTSYGSLIELPVWLEKWRRYREIEVSLNKLEARIAAETVIARRRLVWATVASVVTIASLGLAWALCRRRDRKLRQREFRQRIARDLHDEIGSNLAAIARLGEVAPLEANADQLLLDWQSVRRMASECTESMRETLWLLGGRQEQPGRLLDRLHQVAGRMLPDVKIHWKEDGKMPVFDSDKDVNRELFLLFKELIANIANHSKADTVKIFLSLTDGLFSLAVADNGVGMDQAQSVSGMGIQSMKYRAQKLGGDIQIESNPNDGTKITLRLPVEE